MTMLKAALPALAVVAAFGLAGCGTVDGGHKTTRQSVHLISAGPSHRAGKIGLSSGARRFMKRVPSGDTGYPGIGLVLAPAPAHAVATPAQAARVLRLFYKLPPARALLGGQLRSPEITYGMITDYKPLFRDMKPGGKFPAFILTYHNVACESYGPPADRGPRHLKCTTTAFYDLKNSRWLGIYQYTAGYPGAFKKQ